jgi:hypothetical protein
MSETASKRKYIRYDEKNRKLPPCPHAARNKQLCAECVRLYNQEYNLVHPESNMWHAARERARRAGIPFTISRENIREVWPSDNRCPVFDIPFSGGSGHPIPTSASLDRIRPELGYVPGNIAIISLRANGIKQHEITPDALYRVADWFKSVTDMRQK